MHAHDQSVLSVKQVEDVIAKLTPGSSFVYYRGCLVRDRHLSAETSLRVRARAQLVAALADKVLLLCCGRKFQYSHDMVVDGTEDGALTQRRVGDGVYEYIFTKRGT